MVDAGDLKSLSPEKSGVGDEHLAEHGMGFLAKFLPLGWAVTERHGGFAERIDAKANRSSADDFHGRRIVDERPFLRAVPIIAAARDEHLT